MNRNAIASYVCNKLNKPELIDVCVEFVKRNYVLIFDAYNWRDSEFRYNDQITAVTNQVAVNDAISRVASVRVNAISGTPTILDPVNAVLAQQIDPKIFEAIGVPELYEEVYDVESRTRYIRVYPTPSIDTDITVIGIRKVDELTAADSSPSIRGIDNTLIAFTEADMLERINQYGMADVKRKEAQQKLQDAIALDQQSRSNIPRGVKPMSVNGDTLAELVDAVSARTGKWGPEDRVLIREFVRRNWITAYNSRLWRESQILVSVNMTGVTGITTSQSNSNAGQLVLPAEVGEIIAVKQDTEGVIKQMGIDTSLAYELDPDIFHRTGTPVGYSLMLPVATPVLPSPSEKFNFVSSSDGDRGNVFLRAIDGNGNEFTQTIVLQGSGTPQASFEEILEPLTISKKPTLGAITVTGQKTNFVYLSLRPEETSRKYIRIRLFPAADSSISFLVLGKKALRPFEADEDAPILRGFGNVLVSGATADMFRKAGDEANANAFAQRAAAELLALQKLEVEQAEENSIIVPYTEPSPIGWGSWVNARF